MESYKILQTINNNNQKENIKLKEQLFFENTPVPSNIKEYSALIIDFIQKHVKQKRKIVLITVFFI